MSRLAALGAVGLLALAGCAAPDEPPGRDPNGRGDGRRSPGRTGRPSCPSCCRRSDACLDASGQPAVGVTKAWPIAESLAGVRMLAPGGERLDCVAETEGGDVLLTEKVWTVSQLPGEREPLFTPRSQAEPASSPCLSVSVARDAVGEDVGGCPTTSAVSRGRQAPRPRRTCPDVAVPGGGSS